jgi:selenide,water dikinase
MATLNKTSAELMIKHNANAATDVTGFGILGHAQNLARNQRAQVDFEITHLPIFRNALRVDK